MKINKREEFLRVMGDMLANSGEIFLIYSEDKKGNAAILGNLSRNGFDDIYKDIVSTMDDEKFEVDGDFMVME